jgi:hypothetical protein
MSEKNERGGWTSASNAFADSLCQHRHTMQRGVPEPPRSLDADYGDRIHKALAKDDPAGLSTEETEVYDACQQVCTEKVQEFFGGDMVPQVLRFNEKRVWVKFSSGRRPGVLLQHSGQADRIYRLGPRLLIPDFKTLRGDVPASPLNLQLRDLAAISAKDLIADEVGVFICQPLVSRKPEITLYQGKDLQQAQQEMFDRVDFSNFPQVDTPQPGEVQCKFCLAKEKCVAYQRFAAGMVIAVQTVLDVPVEAWTPEQRRFFCDKFDMAQRWLNETWESIERLAKTYSNYVPGYAMFPGTIRKAITKPGEVFQRFSELAPEGYDANQAFMATVTVALGKLKNELSAMTGLKGMALNTAMDKLIDDCTVSTPTKEQLKPIGGGGEEQKAA